MTLKPHGISFTGEMMKALLNVKTGSWPAEPLDVGKAFKWQTRRLMKPQPPKHCSVGFSTLSGKDRVEYRGYSKADGTQVGHQSFVKCPHLVGRPIWAREAFHPRIIIGQNSGNSHVTFKDGWQQYKDGAHYEEESPKGGFCGVKWKPSIHMPYWAARYHGIVQRVRVERLCDITAEDAVAEGIEIHHVSGGVTFYKDYLPDPDVEDFGASAIQSYKTLIESIHGPDVWESWVFVYDIKRVK